MKTKSIKTATLITFVILSSFALSGCNTMEGLGTDIEKLGDSIKEEAGEHN